MVTTSGKNIENKMALIGNPSPENFSVELSS